MRTRFSVAFLLCSIAVAACGSPAEEPVSSVSQAGIICSFCRPEPITLASGIGPALCLTVDDANVYWGDEFGDVKSVPTGGGAVTTLATGQGPVYGITYAYSTISSPRPIFDLFEQLLWAGNAPDAMELVPKQSAPSAFVSGPQNPPAAVAVDSEHVYWTSPSVGAPGSGAVMMDSLHGGTPTLLSAATYPTALAVDATNVYWVDLASGTLTKKPLAGGPAVTLALVSPYTTSLALDSAAVPGENAVNAYWTETDTGSVKTVPVAGGATVTLASGSGTPYSVAADSTAIYWVNAEPVNGTVVKLSYGESTPITLASNQDDPEFIALDSTNVYWVNFDTAGALMKFAK